MIREEYVSFETATLLKNEGFNQKCINYYLEDGSMFGHCYQEILPKDKEVIECPTQAMAMRWIREVYGVHITIKLTVRKDIRTGFYAKINYIKDGKWLGITTKGNDPDEDNVGYDTYEEAVEAGISFCLRDLII